MERKSAMTISCPECGKKIIARTIKVAYRLVRQGCMCERCKGEQTW